MSQKTHILKAKHKGAPVYLGETSGSSVYSSDPEKIVKWLSDAHRFVFNHAQAHAVIPYPADTTTDDNKVIWLERKAYPDVEGEKLTMKKLRERHSFLRSLPSSVFRNAEVVQKTTWISYRRYRKTMKGKQKAAYTPRFRSRGQGTRFGLDRNKKANSSGLFKFRKVSETKGIITLGGITSQRSSIRNKHWAIEFHVRLNEEINENFTSALINWDRRELVFVSSPKFRHEVAQENKIVGIDRGVAHSFVTSDGEMFHVENSSEDAAKLKALQKKLSRQDHTNETRGGRAAKFSSKRRQATVAKISKLHGKIARHREEQLHCFVNELLAEYNVIVVEDLKIANMTKSAKGTAVNPGRNVAAKSGLNRSILQQGWGEFVRILEYKAKLAGCEVIKVKAAYSSQECSECGRVGGRNRTSQAVFKCQVCGFEANADVNAAIVIRSRGVEKMISKV